MATTDLGFPYPVNADAVDVPGDIQALADAVDAAPGIGAYSQTAIDAFTLAEKRAGRLVFNTTTGKTQVSNGLTFTDLTTTSYYQASPPATANTGDLWTDAS